MQNDLTNVVNPYLTDVGVGLVFGLGYYLIKYLYGDKQDDSKSAKTSLTSKGLVNWENSKTVEDFNHLIKLHEDNPKLNPFEVIDKMNKCQIAPDVTTFNNLLNSCFCSRNFVAAEKLAEEIFDFGSPVHPDLSTFNILLKGISCKLDSIDVFNDSEEAKNQIVYMDKLFSLIKKYGETNNTVRPSDITINTSLDILIKAGEIKRAWYLFENMQSLYDIKPDKYSYSTIIKALKYEADPEKLEKAFGIIDFLKEQSQTIANDEIIFNCLIDVCFKLNLLDKAESIFKEMKELNIQPSKITYAIMVKGYGQLYKLDSAFAVFEEMKLSTIPPNEIIYGCLLNACVRCSNIEKVTEVYREMKQYNLDMNIVLYTTLIKAYTKIKDLKSALNVYYTMMNDTKVNPNIIVHNAILDCCVECGDTKLLNEIYDSIKKKAIENQSDDSTPQPDLITYSTVIKGHARAKDMDKVFDIYNFLKENSTQYKMDEVIFNSILDGCAKTGNFEKAMSIAGDMNSLNIPKSNVTYSILVKIYAGAKQTEKALDLLNEMETEGIKPGVIVYTCLIQTSLKSKQFERAVNLFEKMKKSGCKADHVLYNTIINGCLYNQNFGLACEYTIESFEKNIKIAEDIYNTTLYKLVAPFCTIIKSKKVEYASKIVKEMKNKGLSINEEVFSKVAKLLYQANGSGIDLKNNSNQNSANNNQFSGNSIYKTGNKENLQQHRKNYK